MNIRITRPEVEALIDQHLRGSSSKNPEELIFLALQQFSPGPTVPSGKRSIADVCAKLRGVAEDLEITRDPAPCRDVVL
jgi:hypothetical protein